MDERKPDLKKGASLPDSDFVFRLIPTDLVEKDKFTPKLKGFSLSDNDKEHGYGLSVEWSAITTPEESIARVGASFKKNTDKYKDHTKRDIYALSISFLKSLDSILDVVYDPIFNEPPIRGVPNNISHSLVNFSKEELEKNETEIYTRIREHAKDKKKSVDMKRVDALVNIYRNT
ncbi:MAG: hypothetical protein JWQ09_1009 [Segetibacter sp.]|nr:hypothetical protein [Segetibacter sp.]